MSWIFCISFLFHACLVIEFAYSYIEKLPSVCNVTIRDTRTVEDDIIVDQVDSPEIVDDFELGKDEVIDIKDKDVNKQKLRRRISIYKVSCFVSP